MGCSYSVEMFIFPGLHFPAILLFNSLTLQLEMGKNQSINQ